MVMVTVVIFAHEFKSSGAVAEIETFDDPHLLQQVHGTIDGGQIALAITSSHLGQNFAVRQRMRMFSQDFQDRRPRARNLARLTAQTLFERGQILSFM